MASGRGRQEGDRVPFQRIAAPGASLAADHRPVGAPLAGSPSILARHVPALAAPDTSETFGEDSAGKILLELLPHESRKGMALVFAERGEGAVVLLDDPVEDGPLWFKSAALPPDLGDLVALLRLPAPAPACRQRRAEAPVCPMDFSGPSMTERGGGCTGRIVPPLPDPGGGQI